MGPSPTARYLPFPLSANSVDWPLVQYGGAATALNFTLDDSEDENSGWGRIIFEKFDALRVCRGEHLPYAINSDIEKEWSWIFTVDDSPWLAERYAYEKKHYGTSYEFGGDVEEMLRDFSHYVFRFHDQFVEVICGGLWFETSAKCLHDAEPGPGHASRHLSPAAAIGQFISHGITCQIWKNPRPLEELLAHAKFGSQKLFQFAPELDGEIYPSLTVTLRNRPHRPLATLETLGCNIERSYPRIPTLNELIPHVEQWLGEVQERRRNR